MSRLLVIGFLIVFSSRLASATAMQAQDVAKNGSRDKDQSTSNDQQRAATEQLLASAAKLFDQREWRAARTLYDQAASDQAAITSPANKQLAIERGATCSALLGEWDDALRRATSFHDNGRLTTKQWRYWPSEKRELAQRQSDIQHLEFSRHLLEIILLQAKIDAPQPLQTQLAQQIIAADFELLQLLDPDSVIKREKWGWESGYPNVEWFWEDVRPTNDNFVSDADAGRNFDTDYRYYRDGIPTDFKGRAVALPTPTEYPTTLQRAQKVLYLLDEIERLEVSPSKSDQVRALLHRADLMRRLYGPGTDRSWSHALFFYQYAEQPSFMTPPNVAGLKTLEELDDNEARVRIGHKLDVITLPLAVSPMAIWQRIEKEFTANRDQVAEAVYQRALYYQNRRQFSKAIAEYQRLIEQFPTSDRASIAQTQIDAIRRPDVLLGSTGTYAAGLAPTIWYASRNTTTVEFTARQVDLQGYIRDRDKAGQWWEIAYLGLNVFGPSNAEEGKLKKFLGEQVAQWSQTATSSDQVTTHSTQLPLTQAGAYLIEARVPGNKVVSQSLAILTNVAIIQKPLPNQVLLWAVDARSGQPLPDQPVQFVDDKSRGKWSTLKTNADGAIYLKPKEDQDTFVLLTTEQGDMAFAEVERVGYSQFRGTTTESFAVTDRPVYRPGSTVNFRVWLRQLTNRSFRPSQAGKKVNVVIEGPQFSKSFELLSDESGSVTGSLQLTNQSPLGQYRIAVANASERFSGTAGDFAVEEYKRPEFEVKVIADQKTKRLGEPITAIVQANYYSGQPVKGAEVHYRINRRRHTASYHMPTRWDWLYGPGFGNYTYLYPWLGDSIMTTDTESWLHERNSFGDEDESSSELVVVGVTRLNDQGTAEIAFETSPFLKEFDQRFTITAEVRDESRRTIGGSGTVLATTQQFHAFMQFDRGWYQPASISIVDINTRTANNVAVAASGTATLYRITATKNSRDRKDIEATEIEKKSVQSWPVTTDASGHAQLKLTLPGAGQYRLEYKAQDQWQQPVTTASTFWVCDESLPGTKQNISGLEVIPDKRTYAVGETARLLVHTGREHARLLVVDSMDKHRFVDIPGHSQVIEIPITARHVPNFFFEATMVHDGQVFTESCEVYVPPVKDLLTINLNSDRTLYRPGEQGTVHVNVTNADGQPVAGTLALTAYDKSLHYIQPESESGPKSLLASRRTEYWSDGVKPTLGGRKFKSSGTFTCPEFHLEDGSRPTAGGMGGSPPEGGDASPADGAQAAGSRRAVSLTALTKAPLGLTELVDPNVRTNFSDTAVWFPKLQLDKQGSASADILFPESLTTWRVHGYLVTPDTKVGEAVYELKTNKDLQIRLQSPRFLMESDTVVLSALVHNLLADAKDVSAELILPANIFVSLTTDPADKTTADAQGNLHLIQQARVESGKTHRFDWPVKATASGLATITVKAQTDVESDAMQLAFPVNAHGVFESSSHTGFFRSKETGTKEISFELPETMDAQSAELELNMLPSAAGAAFEALPFLAGYPYGCVEQTMSRFYPTVLAADTLKKLGTDIEAVANTLSSSNKRAERRFARRSVFDSNEIRLMSESGMQRLLQFQHDDGGWGWWEHDESSPYMTAYVLLGLNTAADAGTEVVDIVFERGAAYLINAMKEPANERHDFGSVASGEHVQALAAYVLSLKRSNSSGELQSEIRKLIQKIFADQSRLNPYGRVLLAMALHNQRSRDKAQQVLRDVLKNIKSDNQLETSWIAMPEENWWQWQNSSIETNALLLRAVLAIQPDKDLAMRLANWLASQRSHGSYWRSTRDTALAVHALSEYLLLMQQTTDKTSVQVWLDEQLIGNIEVSWQNMLRMQNRVSLKGTQLTPGKHRLRLVKDQRGPLLYSMNLSYFDKQEQLLAKAQGGIHIERLYYRYSATENGEPTKRLLKPGEPISIGDTIEVELVVKAEKDLEYLAFEDPKPAGCEAIQLRSGYGSSDGLWGNVELRDSQVIFFVPRLLSGQYKLRYKLRAEVPGKFSAMPAYGFAMYTPEIHARSQEHKFEIGSPAAGR